MTDLEVSIHWLAVGLRHFYGKDWVRKRVAYSSYTLENG